MTDAASEKDWEMATVGRQGINVPVQLTAERAQSGGVLIGRFLGALSAFFIAAWLVGYVLSAPAIGADVSYWHRFAAILVVRFAIGSGAKP